MENAYPLKLRPVFKPRIWGSDRLAERFGKALPPATSIGESWELCDFPEDQATVAGGPWAGLSIRALLENHGPIIGFSPDQCAQPFGLLIKLLDANDVLSVQVHPDREACRRFPGAQLKTECWYVLDAEPGSRIFCGLKPGVDRQALATAASEGCTAEILLAHKVKAGDFFYVPAGTVHALGAGVIVAEIQTPSDTTYRLFDWNRTDAQGRGRELHIEQALASIHYEAGLPALPRSLNGPAGAIGKTLLQDGMSLGKAELLAAGEFFSIVRVGDVRPGRQEWALTQPVVMMVAQGRGEATSPGGVATAFQAGDTLLLPRGKRLTMTITDEATLLLTCLGPERP